MKRIPRQIVSCRVFAISTLRLLSGSNHKYHFACRDICAQSFHGVDFQALIQLEFVWLLNLEKGSFVNTPFGSSLNPRSYAAVRKIDRSVFGSFLYLFVLFIVLLLDPFLFSCAFQPN